VDNDVFEMEVLKEEFAFRTHVAIALANNQLARAKKGVTISVSDEYFCKEIRDIVKNLPEIRIPRRSKANPMPVSSSLLSYEYPYESAPGEDGGEGGAGFGAMRATAQGTEV
jgi:hypothetical protein